MTNSIAISVNNLGKCYRVYPSPQARLLQGIVGKRKQLYQESWALRGVDFELTVARRLVLLDERLWQELLQMLCGTLMPSEET